jgi:hypothetical protein
MHEIRPARVKGHRTNFYYKRAAIIGPSKILGWANDGPFKTFDGENVRHCKGGGGGQTYEGAIVWDVVVFLQVLLILKKY